MHLAQLGDGADDLIRPLDKYLSPRADESNGMARVEQLVTAIVQVRDQHFVGDEGSIEGMTSIVPDIFESLNHRGVVREGQFSGGYRLATESDLAPRRDLLGESL